MHVGDELVALTSLLGSMLVSAEQMRVEDAARAELAGGLKDVPEQAVMAVARLLGAQAALRTVAGTRADHPNSELLLKLEEALERTRAERDADVQRTTDSIDPEVAERTLAALRGRNVGA